MAYRRGVAIGSAFMDSAMRSYSNAQLMQANIMQFKQNNLRYQEERDYRRSRDTRNDERQATIDERYLADRDYTRGRQAVLDAQSYENVEKSEYADYNNYKQQDAHNAQYSDLANTNYADEYKERFMIDRIGGPPKSNMQRAGDMADEWLQEDIGPAPAVTGAVAPVSSSRIGSIGKARYKSTMFGEVPAYHDTVDNVHYGRDPSKPGEIGSLLEAEAEFESTDKKNIPAVKSNVETSLKIKTDELNVIPTEAIANSEKRATIVLDMVTSAADEAGVKFDGTPEGWDALGPQTQDIVSDGVVDAIFNAQDRTSEEKAQLAYSLANVTDKNITEKVTTRFIADVLKPSLLERFKAATGRDLTFTPWPKISAYTVQYDTGRIQEAVKDVSNVVENTLIAAGPEVVQGFLGDTKDGNGEPINIESPEAKALIKANVRQAVDKFIKFREKEPGTILPKIGEVLKGSMIPGSEFYPSSGIGYSTTRIGRIGTGTTAPTEDKVSEKDTGGFFEKAYDRLYRIGRGIEAGHNKESVLDRLSEFSTDSEFDLFEGELWQNAGRPLGAPRISK